MFCDGRAEPGLQGRGDRSGRPQPGRQRGRPPHPRRLPRPGRARRARCACRRGHDRVRERAGGGARIPGAHRARHAVGGERRDRAGPDQRKGVPRPAAASPSRPTRCCATTRTRAPRTRRCCRGSSRARASATTARARSASRTAAEVVAAFRAMGGIACVLEQRVALACEVSVVVARNEHGRDRDVAGGRESPPRRHPRRLDRAGARSASARAGGAGDRHRDRREARLPRRAVRRDVRDGGRRAAGQRDRAAAAQQRPLHDRRLRHLAVRAAGARARRAPAGRHARARAGGDGEPAGRHLVRDRRCSVAARARLGAGAAASAGEAAPLRQGASRAAAARWATSPASPPRSEEALATAREIKRDLGDSRRRDGR